MPFQFSRRAILANLGAIGAFSLASSPSLGLEALPRPETTTVRLPRWLNGSYCWAAEYLAGELLRQEGFTDLHFIQGDPKLDHSAWMAEGLTDFSINYPPNHIAQIDTGLPIKVIAGLHSGCLELIAKEWIETIPDLKGKRVGITALGSSAHMMLSLIAAYVGMEPTKDIDWVVVTHGSARDAFIEGQVDAFLGGPPTTQELRARKIGHTIVNQTTDPPWSQHFCCMISVSTDYMARYPMATKLVLRAILKMADLCATNTGWVAEQMAARGFVPSYEKALQALAEIRYDRWRDFDAEDSVRFYALRMQETGMIRSAPQEILAKGTDWRILNELKHELKQ
jgi:NitT/TauT family transport system substrate-binding protein